VGTFVDLTATARQAEIRDEQGTVIASAECG
jgi:hypothetical protein